MRGEFCIVQLVRWNTRLREAICQMVGLQPLAGDPDYILSVFRNMDALSAAASGLGCDVAEIFVELKDRLQRSFVHTTSGTRSYLAPTDVTMFFDETCLERVALIVDCSPKWEVVVDTLFDVSQMKKLLRHSELLDTNERVSAGQLFWRMVTPEGSRRVCEYMGGPNDIWAVLSTLIRPLALEKLCKYLDCHPGDVFGALAADDEDRAVTSRARVADDGTQRLDPFAVAKVKEELLAVSQSYLSQAFDAAKRTRESHTTARNAGLTALLHYHMKHAFRLALQEAAETGITVGDLGGHLELRSVPPSNRGTRLRATTREETDSSSVIVEGRLSAEEEWKPLLELRDLPIEAARHIKQHFGSVSQELEGAGEKFPRRFLGLMLPPLPTAGRAVWEVSGSIADSLTRYFVLSGCQLADAYGLRQHVEIASSEVMLAPKSGRTVCTT